MRPYRFALLVGPALGDLDATAIADTVLEAIGGGSGGERLMELQRRRGAVLRVVREPPWRPVRKDPPPVPGAEQGRDTTER